MSNEDRGFPVGPTDAESERSLFDSIMDGSEDQGAAQGGQQPGEGEGEGEEQEGQDGGEGEGEGRARDAQGRFIEPQQRPQGERPPQAGDRAQKGLRHDLTTERGRRQALETAIAERDQRLAAAEAKLEVLLRQQQAPAQPAQGAQPATAAEQAPDMYTDPEGFRNFVIRQAQEHAVQRIEQEAQARADFSLQAAQARDPQAFGAAYQAAQSLDPQSKAQVLQRLKIAPDAGTALLDWHRQHQARLEIGADPNAYRERVRAEIADPQKLMQDPAFAQAMTEYLRQQAGQGGANGGPRTATQLPPSLNGSRGSNARTGAADAYDNSERGVFEYATRG